MMIKEIFVYCHVEKTYQAGNACIALGRCSEFGFEEERQIHCLNSFVQYKADSFLWWGHNPDSPLRQRGIMLAGNTLSCCKDISVFSVIVVVVVDSADTLAV